MMDEMRDRANDTTVSPAIVNLVVILAWLPPLLLLVSVGIAAVGIGIETFQTGSLPAGLDLGFLTSEVSLLAVGGAIGGFYWLLAHVTFGGRVVEEATENAEQAKDAVENGGED